MWDCLGMATQNPITVENLQQRLLQQRFTHNLCCRSVPFYNLFFCQELLQLCPQSVLQKCSLYNLSFVLRQQHELHMDLPFFTGSFLVGAQFPSGSFVHERKEASSPYQACAIPAPDECHSSCHHFLGFPSQETCAVPTPNECTLQQFPSQETCNPLF